MTTMPPNMNNDGNPFKNAKESKALKEENTFMQEHGGWGVRVVYFMGEIFSIGLILFTKLTIRLKTTLPHSKTKKAQSKHNK